MWTMVSIIFSSEGGYASEVDRIMREMGFVTALGENDYVFRWEKEDAATEEAYRELEAKVIALIDEVQNRLRGYNVRFKFKTIRSF